MTSLIKKTLLLVLVALVALVPEVNAQNGRSSRHSSSSSSQGRSSNRSVRQSTRQLSKRFQQSGSQSSSRPSSSSPYLRVDGSSTAQESHAPWDGGRQWFDVSTNESGGYTLWGVPSWCSIEDRSSRGFYLVYNSNRNNEERTDYFEVRTSNNRVRINVGQDENPVEINNVWLTHNVMHDGVKCLEIHVDFSVDDMEGQDIIVLARFYLGDNQTRLIDNDNDPIFVIDTDDATWASTHWRDFKLYIPNNTLLHAKNFVDEITFDIIIGDEDGNIINYKENCASIVASSN